MVFSAGGMVVAKGAHVEAIAVPMVGVEVGVFVEVIGGNLDGLMSITVKIAAISTATCKA